MTLAVRTDQAGLWVRLRSCDGVERELRKVASAQRRRLGDRHPDTLRTRFWIGRMHAIRGESDEAVGVFTAVITYLSVTAAMDSRLLRLAWYALSAVHRSPGRFTLRPRR